MRELGTRQCRVLTRSSVRHSTENHYQVMRILTDKRNTRGEQ